MINAFQRKRSQSGMFTSVSLGVKIFGLATLFSFSSVMAEEIIPPQSLSSVNIPEPSNLYEFIKDKPAAVALGKALFWDRRVGSDGKTACASCHFHAGADNRIINQFGPAHDRNGYHQKSPNLKATANDFPLTLFNDSLKNDSDSDGYLVRDVRDVFSSQGVFNGLFISTAANVKVDEFDHDLDIDFNDNGVGTRKVEPRNTPTMINAVFNLRNFWDGRAQTIFNGVNPFGKRDLTARVYKNKNGVPVPTKVSLNDASLASQASGPPLSAFEMSAAGRSFPDLGKKVLPMRALAGQTVALDDSVLGSMAKANGNGLTKTYRKMVKDAFKNKWWKATAPVSINGNIYSHMEANYSLLFSLAIQMYESTLVSGESAYDKWYDGDDTAMTDQQVFGLQLFMDKGKCASCHGGPAFSNASNSAIFRDDTFGKTERLSRMIMGDNEEAVYDEGFYNIGVTRTEDDIGVGGLDPFGNALSFARNAAKGSAHFFFQEEDFPNVDVSPSERIAVEGSFKVPTLRNIALTAPYFHNGGVATLRGVVEFYNRGGNFPHNNRDNLDSDIQKLDLSETEIDALVAFMGALTDSRVRDHAGPFDHPSLVVTNGHKKANGGVKDDPATGVGIDKHIKIPAVGQSGYGPNNPIQDFLGIDQLSGSN